MGVLCSTVGVRVSFGGGEGGDFGFCVSFGGSGDYGFGFFLLIILDSVFLNSSSLFFFHLV